MTDQYLLVSYNTINRAFTISPITELPEGEDAMGWFYALCYDEFDQPYHEKRTYVIDDAMISAFGRGAMRILHG